METNTDTAPAASAETKEKAFVNLRESLVLHAKSRDLPHFSPFFWLIPQISLLLLPFLGLIPFFSLTFFQSSIDERNRQESPVGPISWSKKAEAL